MSNICNSCGRPYPKCTCKKECSPCGKGEPVFSVEPLSDDPTVYRFNVNGKSVLVDTSSATKAGETCTTLSINVVERLLRYFSECGENTITAQQLGSILHLADLGDVDANSIVDNGILNYRKNSDCGEGCEGIADGWTSSNPIDVGTTSLDYILGSDADGKMESLMPPTDTTTFSYLAWAGADKAKWAKPTQVSVIPVDGDNNTYPLYLDPNTGEIVVYKKGAE